MPFLRNYSSVGLSKMHYVLEPRNQLRRQKLSIKSMIWFWPTEWVHFILCMWKKLIQDGSTYRKSDFAYEHYSTVCMYVCILYWWTKLGFSTIQRIRNNKPDDVNNLRKRLNIFHVLKRKWRQFSRT